VDRVGELIEVFRAAGMASDDEAWPNVQAVVELEDLIGDARVVPFFVSVVADPHEHDLARIECLKILRCTRRSARRSASWLAGRSLLCCDRRRTTWFGSTPLGHSGRTRPTQWSPRR
jgi:hypothetical protein